jgi:hypothetical protein
MLSPEWVTVPSRKEAHNPSHRGKWKLLTHQQLSACTRRLPLPSHQGWAAPLSRRPSESCHPSLSHLTEEEAGAGPPHPAAVGIE